MLDRGETHIFLSKKEEHEPLDLDAADADGNPVIPENAHARLAAPQTNDGAQILRRAYSYDNGVSFTAEFGIKGIYENTIGRLTDVVRAGGPGGAPPGEGPDPAGNREMALRLAQSMVDVEVLRVHVLRSAGTPSRPHCSEQPNQSSTSAALLKSVYSSRSFVLPRL